MSDFDSLTDGDEHDEPEHFGDEPRHFDRPRDDGEGAQEYDDDDVDMRNVGASRVLAEEYEEARCMDCGQVTASEEGLCYECQTLHHGIDFDMDGRGWL